MSVSHQNSGDKTDSVLCGSCPESSFDLFWDVKVSGKREFQALSATPFLHFLSVINPVPILYNV